MCFLVYKRYASPFDKKSEEKPKTEVYTKNEKADNEASTSAPPPEKKKNNPVSLGFLDKLSTDDIILIALIIILLSEEKEKRDVPMILTLGFLFLIQYIDSE